MRSTETPNWAFVNIAHTSAAAELRSLLPAAYEDYVTSDADVSVEMHTLDPRCAPLRPHLCPPGKGFDLEVAQALGQQHRCNCCPPCQSHQYPSAV